MGKGTDQVRALLKLTVQWVEEEKTDRMHDMQSGVVNAVKE